MDSPGLQILLGAIVLSSIVQTVVLVGVAIGGMQLGAVLDAVADGPPELLYDGLGDRAGERVAQAPARLLEIERMVPPLILGDAAEDLGQDGMPGALG